MHRKRTSLHSLIHERRIFLRQLTRSTQENDILKPVGAQENDGFTSVDAEEGDIITPLTHGKKISFSTPVDA